MSSDRYEDDNRNHRDDSSHVSKPQRNAAPLVSRTADVRRSAPHSDAIESYRPTEPPSDPRQRAQLLREFGTRMDGQHKVKLRWNNAQSSGDARQSKAASKLARFWIGPLSERIESEAATLASRRGPKNKWHSAYQLLGAETLAEDTAFAILDLLIKRTAGTRDKKIVSQAVARAIGRQISTAYRLRAWQKMQPALFSEYERRLDRAGATPQHRDAVKLHGLQNRARGANTASPEFLELSEPWSVNESAQIGAWLLWMSVDVAKGAIALTQRFNPNGTIREGYYYVTLAPRAVRWLEGAVEGQAARATNNRTMIARPRPWHGPHNGGYLLGDDLRFDGITNMVRGIPPVRKAIEDALSASDEALKAAAPVLVSLTLMQDTTLAISEGVHDIAMQAANAGLKLEGLPASFRQERVPKAPATGDTEADREQHARWKRLQAEVENRNARNVSRALHAQSVLAEASELRELNIDGSVSNGPFHFVHRTDARGRIYCAGNALNVQGGDLSRSLLRFHRGRPIGDDRGPFWLAAEVARTFGKDKLSWADRIAWTHANSDFIERIAIDPLGHRGEWERTTDKLWAALAAAREWQGYRAQGAAFVTTLPCYVDATASGLQHLATLSGDTVLARLVNLEPGDRPQDIYRSVADEAYRDIKVRAEKGRSIDREMGRLWLRLLGDEVPRAMAKTVVMTKPYGATYSVILEAVRDFLAENDRKRQAEWRSVPDDELPKLRGWLANRLRDAVKGRTGSADAIMEWLQDALRLMCDHGVADKLQWVTPSGFPFRGNLYYGHSTRKLKTTVAGTVHSMTIAENDTRKFDRKSAVSAIAPGFVHSLDAAALQLAICKAKSRGISDILGIHDAVGFLAPDGDVIADAVRVGFVKCHEAGPLGRFREAVLMALPDDAAREDLRRLPERGKFDVRRVLGSGYFFC